MAQQLFSHMSKVNPDEFSPAVWAYIGDAVYELFVRQQLVSAGPAKTRDLHKEATTRVRAGYQAELVKRIEPFLTQREQEIVKRGRNVKSGHVPAGSDVITYRYSTAFEALLGYLYLCGETERLNELLVTTHTVNEMSES